METQSRIFKVVVQFQEKDEVFYTRIKSQNGIPASLLEIIVSRYPSLSSLVKRCYVKDKTGAEFAIINNDDLSVFLDGEDLFENVVQVEINGVQRDSELVSPAKKVRIAEQEVSLPAKDDDEMMKPVHKNVICDCCDQTIVGYRYKCSECFNFDLCMTCEGKMRHREHIMIRIPEPSLSYSPCRFVKLNRGTNTTETAQPCGEEKSRRHHHKRHHHRRHGGRPHTMFDGLFRQFDPEGLVSDPDTDTPPQQGAQSNTENAATGGVPPPQPPYDFQKLVKAVETVAGNVAKFLEPLGMTMDYDFPTATGTASASCPFAAKTPTPTETVTPAKEKTPEPSVMVIDDSLEKSPENKEPIPSTSTASVPEPFIVDVIEDEPEKQPSIIEPTTAGDRSSPASNISGDDAEWLVISNEGLPDSPQKEATPVSVPDPIAPQIPAVASTSAQTHGYDELARKLQKDIEEQLRINSATASTQTSIPVQQPTVLVQQPTVPVIHHPAPHINMSIQRMIDMGFSNDGDSLTNLMVCCNGDIRRALDMLLHKK